MRIHELAMPCLNTTFMGVVQGVLDYWKSHSDVPATFGASGHAFVINVHQELCPSGPYSWDMNPVMRLLENVGVRVIDLGFFSPASSGDARGRVEARLKVYLDRGIPCSLLNVEHQLITGYDDSGFFTAQPWPPKDFPPSRLSFGNWKELGDESHVTFFTFELLAPLSRRTAAIAALRYAIDLFERPQDHTREPYGIGPLAYRNWTAAIAQHGASHGNWWNAMVWSECRKMASRYVAALGNEFQEIRSHAAELAAAYERLGSGLERASDRSMPANAKAKLIADLAALDENCVATIRDLLTTLERA